ncbi:MAG: helix-turn-helix transcriptional regulator [Clostridia bacterium]|nr:helix-turn-helix transcriptional regulator [Clostridia bacterium]
MNNLRYYREKAGLTLAELANRTGIVESSINRAEHGVTDLTGQRWKILAKALGCTIDELLGNGK